MARTIYEKSTRLLLKDMLDEWKLQPGQVFTSSRVLEWFAKTYPKLSPVSLRAHLVQASTNDRSRLHHPSTNGTDDLLFKVGNNAWRAVADLARQSGKVAMVGHTSASYCSSKRPSGSYRCPSSSMPS